MDEYETAVDVSSYMNIEPGEALALLRKGEVHDEVVLRAQGDFDRTVGFKIPWGRAVVAEALRRRSG